MSELQALACSHSIKVSDHHPSGKSFSSKYYSVVNCSACGEGHVVVKRDYRDALRDVVERYSNQLPVAEVETLVSQLQTQQLGPGEYVRTIFKGCAWWDDLVVQFFDYQDRAIVETVEGLLPKASTVRPTGVRYFSMLRDGQYRFLPAADLLNALLPVTFKNPEFGEELEKLVPADYLPTVVGFAQASYMDSLERLGSLNKAIVPPPVLRPAKKPKRPKQKQAIRNRSTLLRYPEAPSDIHIPLGKKTKTTISARDFHIHPDLITPSLALEYYSCGRKVRYESEAEGVEAQGSPGHLELYSCSYCDGFHFGHPPIYQKTEKQMVAVALNHYATHPKNANAFILKLYAEH